MTLLLGAFALPRQLAVDFADYHTYAEMTAALRGLASAHPNLASLESAGTTVDGREVWVVTLGNRSGTSLEDRPALLMAANLEGNQVAGSEVALGAIEYMLDGYGSNEEVTRALDEHTIYIFPRVNPDGAERMFASVQTGSAANASAYDDDNDGRTDEDEPNDLNGDGLITVMRVPDPKGKYMIDPADERLMKKADPKKGESGAYSIYWEGTDDDGDGFYNEDADGGTDLNRNFQHEYPYYQRGAGLHMVSERESRAMMDFVVGHRNIAMMLVLGASDNLISPPNNRGELAAAAGIDLFAFAEDSYSEAGEVGMMSTGVARFFGFRGGGGGQDGGGQGGGGGGRKPATTVNSADLDYFTAVSDRYGEITGIETAPALRKPEGAFFQYGYYQYGVPSFTTPGWGLDAFKSDEGGDGEEEDGSDDGGEGNAEGGDAEDGDEEADTRAENGARSGTRGGGGGNGDDASFDKKLIDWMDGVGVDGHVAWSAYDHPTLGDVEIGGFKPYEAVNPPASVIEEQGARHGEFAVYLTSLSARVRIADTEVINHGGGIFRIKAEVENAGFLPTSTAHGVTSRSVAPTMVQLGVDPEAIISGDSKTSFFQAMDGSGNRETYEWIIRADRGDRIDLTVRSQKGGSDTATISLQ